MPVGHSAVVGAGPTGLMLANLLVVYGLACVLIERNASTVHGYGSHYYSARGRVFAKVQPTEQPWFSAPQRVPPAGAGSAVAPGVVALSGRHCAVRA